MSDKGALRGGVGRGRDRGASATAKPSAYHSLPQSCRPTPGAFLRERAHSTREILATMRILYVTPEVYPLVKTGGLADVAGALPKALRRLGADVRLLVPGYPAVLAGARTARVLGTIGD